MYTYLPFNDRNYESFIEYSQTLGEIKAFVNIKMPVIYCFLDILMLIPQEASFGCLWKIFVMTGVCG